MNKVQQQLTNAREQYVAQHGVEPKYADVVVRFDGEDENENQVIRILDEDEKGVDTESFFDDDEIFFYVQNFDELISLCDQNSGEDFVIVDCNDLFEEL
jgi:hypothetical protein